MCLKPLLPYLWAPSLIPSRGEVEMTVHRSERLRGLKIAFQLSGEYGFNVVAEHEKEGVAPAGEVIRKFLPNDRPSIILVDELLNYISRNRKSGLSAQLYSFIQNFLKRQGGMTEWY